MKRIIPLALASVLAAFSVRAEVLVYEGFHSADYNNVGDNTQMTPNANVSNNHSVGFKAGNWAMNGSQPRVYGANFGLALPAAMAAANFSTVGGSIGLNPDNNHSDLRSTSHDLVSGKLNVSTGTLYVRMLLNLDSNAAGKLVAGASLARKSGGYFGFGLTQGGTDYDLPTKSKSAVSFVIWKNSSGQYVLSFVHTTASGTDFTSYPIITGITLGTTYLCYAEVQVGAGTDGKEILRAGAMAVGDYTTDTPWAKLDGDSDSVEVELISDSSYPTSIAVAGPYGTNGGRFRADEFVVGTELSDILLATTTKPKLLNGALSPANGTYAVSASLANSAANVSYVLSNGTTATTNAIAAFADGDTVSAAFAAPTDDTTYEVLLVAENAGGETAELSLGTIYGGSLSLGAATDANETGLVAGGVTVSRAAADPLPLTVNYTISGSAGSEGATWAAPVAVTIPAGSASAVLPVTPVSDPDVTEDVTITVSLAAGNYGLPSANAATLTLVNHRAAVPADFAKKITLTPSETALAKIGETAWTDFPVLVRLPAEASAQLQSANGTDLYVTDENGTSLPFEVDTFDPAGETLVWVKVPSLSAATALTVYFGGAANADNDPTAVWSVYVGVWHMDEASGSVADATGHGLTASVMGNSANSVAVAGAVGNGRQTATAAAKGYLSVPNYDRFGLGGTFTMSGWVKMSGCTGYPRLFSRKANYGDANGWEMEMSSGSMANFSARGINNSPGYSGTFSPSLQNAWSHVVLVYDGATLTVYQNGAQIKTGAITAATDNGLALSFGCDSDGSETYLQGAFDECRLMDGTATADGVALDWLAQSDPAFFDAGAVEDVDPTAQKFQTPTVVRNADGTYTVTVVLSENSGDVGVIYDAGAESVTNLLATAAAPGTFTDTPASLPADTTYAFAAYGRNANGTEVVKEGGVFYNGELTVEKISDAAENGLVPGVFRISRADTAHDLVVAYTVGGTAITGQTYAALSGTATIPAGSNSVDVAVAPLLDAQTTSDTTVSVALAAGLYGIDAQAGSAELTVANLVAPAGYNTWIATAPGLASVGSNWSEGHAPLATENVLFDGRFSTADCEWDAAAPATVASWTQAADYSGAVTFKTTFVEADATLTALAITGDAVINGGTWTLPTATSPQTSPLYRLKVSVGGSLTIASGASITVSGKAPWSTVSGCAYGGSCDSSSAYGNVLEPADPGQSWPIPGGATGEYLHPAFGGGAIWLEVAGATTLDGSILANGGYSKGWDHYYGSGGGIYLKTASLAGSGTISADGNSTGGSNGGNASAGGRISILLTGAAEMALPLANVHALGSSEYGHQGGAGTIVIRTTSLANGRLVVRNLPSYGAYKHYPPKERTTPVLAGETWTFDEIVFGANGVLRIPAGATLSLPNGLASVSGSSALGANRDSCGILLDGGTLDIADTAETSHVVGNGQWMLSPNVPLTLNGSLAVQGGAAVGAIRLRNESTNSFTKMDLVVKGDMTVASDGYILAEGAGLTGGDAKSLFDGTTYGAHGGAVGCTSETDSPADVAYDSILSPSLPGNRGSSTTRYGSGVALLTVEGALTLDGTASANAIGGHWYGAPGTLNITAGSLSGSGKITANGNQGGQWDADNNYHLYPGGGRVAVRLTDAGATFPDGWAENVQARGVSYMGGGSNDQRLHHATAGTVYLQDGTQPEGAGTVRIFQNNATVNWTTVCTNDFTAFPSTRHGGENDDLRKVSLEIGGGAHVLVSVDKARANSLSIAEHSTLNLYGRTLTVRTARIGGVNVPPGTYTAASTLAIGDGTLGDYLVDTADGAGGTLRVLGAAFLMLVK